MASLSQTTRLTSGRIFDYLVVGAGAMGSTLAAHLTRVGAEVALVARGARADEVRQHGLRVCGESVFETSAVVVSPSTDAPQARVVVVATKAIDTAQTLSCLSHLQPESVLSLQNGVQKDQFLKHWFGAEKVLGAVAQFSATLEPAGTARLTVNHGLLLGELDGTQGQRAHRIARQIDGSGLRAKAVTHINDHLWSKFVIWASIALVALATGKSTGELLSDLRSSQQVARIVAEIAVLARRESITLIDDGMLPAATLARLPIADSVALLQRTGLQLQRMAPEHRVSTLQDAQHGRPLELGETIGYVLGRAESLGLPLSLTRAMLAEQLGGLSS